MNWARGLKFAGIHLVIAITLIALEEIPRWLTAKTHSLGVRISVVFAAYQEEPSTVDFTPMCEEWRSISWPEKVLGVSETPAFLLSGWDNDCPAAWTVAGMLGIDMMHRSLTQRLASGLSLCVLVAIQWFLLGGLPLVKPRRWWLEPGAANTALTGVLAVLGVCAMVLISIRGPLGANVLEVVTLPLQYMLLFTWTAWLGLLLWRSMTFGWRLARSGTRASTR